MDALVSRLSLVADDFSVPPAKFTYTAGGASPTTTTRKVKLRKG